MAFEFTDAEKLKISAITGGQGGLASLTSKLGLEPIPSDAVENELQRWIKYVESDPGLKRAAYDRRDTDGSHCNWCIGVTRTIQRKGVYGPINVNKYRDASGNLSYDMWHALGAAAVGYEHYQRMGKAEGRKLAPIVPNMTAKFEEIRKALAAYELDSTQKKAQMFSRFGSLTGFNAWNRTVDKFTAAFLDGAGGQIKDHDAHLMVSLNPEAAAQIIKRHAEAKRSGKSFVITNQEKEAITDGGKFVQYGDMWELRDQEKSNKWDVDPLIFATTPYDFENKSRYIGNTEEGVFDSTGHLKETDTYVLAKDTGKWFQHSKLGWMLQAGADNWHYSASYGWMYMDTKAMDDNYTSDGWVWTNQTKQWLYPMVGGKNGKTLYFATDSKGKDGKRQWLYVEHDGKITSGADNIYYVHDGEKWTKLNDSETPQDLLEDRIDLVVDTDGFLEDGKKVTEELASFATQGSYLDDKIEDISARVAKANLEYDEYMEEKFDTVAKPIDYQTTSSQPMGWDESNGDIPSTISYDIDGGYGVDAALLTNYQMRLNDIARDMRYKGVNEGLIPSLIKKTELYKDLMDSLGGSDAAEAGQLLDMMVQAAAEKTAEDTNIAKNLTMFDARGGGMLDPMMNLQQKLAVRTAKPSRYATAADVERGYAEGIGQLIKNPDYDPNLSYYFEYRNPETGKLETRAFRPDMPGKQPFMENQERLIDGANMVIDSHIDKLLNRGEDGLSDYERKLNKTINLLKSEGLIADEGGDDLYTKEGIKQLNYIFGDDEDSYTGKREDYNEMNKFLRERQNYYEGLTAQEGLDNSAKLRAAIEDTAPVENARQRAAERMRLARFGGDIGSGSTLFDNSLTAKVNPVNLNNITGKGTLYTDAQLKELGIDEGLANAPVMTDKLKQNQYSKNIIVPQ